MQEITTAAFRNAHARILGGFDEYVAPFVRLEKGGIDARSLRDLTPANNGGVRVVPQILAKTAEETRALMEQLLGMGYRRIDVNLCCPFVKVVQKGYGSGILAHIEDVRTVLETALGFEGVAISAKLRLGNESAAEAQALLPLLNELPLCHLVLHPRTARQQYEGTPDWEAYARFADACAHPLYANGDIRTPEDAGNFQQVMLGRGLLADPLLPLKLKGQEPPPQWRKQFLNALKEECIALHQQPLLKLKVLWEFLLPMTERKILKAIQKAKSMDDYDRILLELQRN